MYEISRCCNRREFLRNGLILGVGGLTCAMFSPVPSSVIKKANAAEVAEDAAACFADMSFQEVAAVALLEEDGWWGQATTVALNLYFRNLSYGSVDHQYYPNVSQNSALTSGWNCDSSLVGDPLIKKIQFYLNNNVTADGIIGSGTISALQMRMGTYVDGYLTGPSPCVSEMQRRLNAGTF